MDENKKCNFYSEQLKSHNIGTYYEKAQYQPSTLIPRLLQQFSQLKGVCLVVWGFSASGMI